MNRHVIRAVLLASCFCGPPAIAEGLDDQYLACDGYPAARKRDFEDGLRVDATTFDWHNPSNWVDAVRRPTTDSAASIAACDAALANIPPRHWVRKANLLEARALHRLYNGDTKAALADLDEAEANTRKDDVFYERSLGLDLAMARAYVLRRGGDQVGGENLAMHTMTSRPYNREVPTLAMLAVGRDVNPEDKKIILRQMATLQPSRIAILFDMAFNDGEYAEAIALYPHLVPNLEVATAYRKGEEAQLEWRNFRRTELFWAEYASEYAYALAATGKSFEAQAAMEAARTRLTGNTMPPPPLSEKKARDKEEVSLHQGLTGIRVRVAAEGAELLEQWNQLVERRISVTEGKSAVVAATLTGNNKLPLTIASAELVDAMSAQLPAAQRPPAGLAADIRGKLAKDRADQFPNEFPSALLKFSIAPEAFERLPPYEESAPLLAMEGSPNDLNTEGWRSSKPQADGSIRVSYRGISGSRAMTEEFALLRAAELARQSGKKAMVITDREDVAFSSGYYYMGVSSGGAANGYYARMNILFFDPATLPPEYQSARWRVLDADAVYEALAPLYIPKDDDKTAKKKKKA